MLQCPSEYGEVVACLLKCSLLLQTPQTNCYCQSRYLKPFLDTCTVKPHFFQLWKLEHGWLFRLYFSSRPNSYTITKPLNYNDNWQISHGSRLKCYTHLTVYAVEYVYTVKFNLNPTSEQWTHRLFKLILCPLWGWSFQGFTVYIFYNIWIMKVEADPLTTCGLEQQTVKYICYNNAPVLEHQRKVCG